MCYLVLVHLALDGEDYSRVGEARDDLVEQVRTLSYAQKLWKMFRIIIHYAVSGMKSVLECSAQEVMNEVDRQIERFFADALQLDPNIIQHEHCPNGAVAG